MRGRAAVAVLAALLLIPLGSFSGADFGASAPNPLNAFSSAADFGPLTVSMDDPGPYLAGSATLQATTSGTTWSVTMQRSPAGAGTWVDACVATAAPFACSFDTTAVAEGAYDFRAVAAGAGSTVVSAAVTGRSIDNTAPAPVTLDDPGAGTLSGTRALTGTAADASAGVVEWKVQHAPAGSGTWSDACTSAAEPYGCSLDTVAVGDGVYDLRAVATDAAGNTAASAVLASRRIDNDAPTVSVTHPGFHLRGTVELAATAADGGGVASVALQRAPAGSGTWTPVCTDTVAPFSCTLATGALPDGLYDLRAIATDEAARSTTSAVLAGVRIDNAAPAGVVLNDPGGAIFTGTMTFSGTATDSGSGVASWKLQHSPAGAGTWTDGCTATVAPYSCPLDTTTLSDGSYDLRAVATDFAGNATVSAVRAGRRVDNVAPAVAVNDPGPVLVGTMTFSAAASDAGGIASVRLQGRSASSGSWGDVCTDTTAPYTCTYDTRNAADGLYYMQAIATDTAGRTTVSAELGPVRVDNTAPVSVSLSDPGALLSGSQAFSGTAGDAGSGVATWRLLASPAGAGSWAELCSDAGSPYGCTIDTAALADGLYDFRAVATDVGGNSASATRSARRVDNDAPAAGIVAPPAAIRGTVTIDASGSDAGGIASVRVERSPAGAGAWTAICTDTTAPYACGFASTAVADGLYDFRAVATDLAGRVTATAPSAGHHVDNAAPTAVTLADPGAVLTGSAGLAGTASDSGSGIDTVRFQYRGDGTGTWTDACTTLTAPYTCTAATAAIADGLHDFRALATDMAGNTTSSALRTGIRVDNNAPTATLTDPGALAPGEPLAATATDGGGTGVTAVTLQIRLSGAPTWTDVCTDAVAPYSCALAGMTDGASYDLRAVATDGIGLTGQSVLTGRVYDATAPAVTMNAPASPMRGTATLSATATDAGSGVASVRYERAPAGTSTWTTLCLGSSSPFSCSWNSALAADGTYDFRAVAVDAAGHSTASAVIGGRVIDNTGPAGVDVQTTNAGTARVMEPGDGLVFTYGEDILPSSVLGGWSGAPLAIEVRVRNAAADELSLFSGATQIPFASPGQSRLSLNGNYVTADTVFAATISLESGRTVRIVLGALQSGAVAGSPAATGSLSWRPSAAITDLAGNGSQQIDVAESGGNDGEF